MGKVTARKVSRLALLKVSHQIRKLLCCPLDKSTLEGWEGNELGCKRGHRYPIVQGVPVFTVEGGKKGFWGMEWDKSLRSDGVDPFVAQVIGATGGFLYKPLIGSLPRYPIPEFRFQSQAKELLLDIGCNWGRWTMAATKAGFTAIGVDPHLDAILAAYRVAEQLGIRADFVVADARYLPFKKQTLDRVFSYSVLQHFAKDDSRTYPCRNPALS